MIFGSLFLVFFGVFGSFAESMGPLTASQSEAEMSDSFQREFPVRRESELLISNLRGSISLQGWSQDKIRVVAKRIVKSSNPEEAQALFKWMDIRFNTDRGELEVSAEYGKSLDIEARLKERRDPRTRMELTVFAPANRKLKIWTVDGEVKLKYWNNALEVRTAKGKIDVKQVRGPQTTLVCPECQISTQNIQGNLRCMGGSSAIEIKNVEGKSIYVETTSGSQDLSQMNGEQFFMSSSGNIHASHLVGKIEFHSTTGVVALDQVDGFVSGRTSTGAISVKADRWKFEDKALIESEQGNIALFLPVSFKGNVDLLSLKGSTKLGFLYEADPSVSALESGSKQRILGKIGSGGELLRVFSRTGSVEVRRNEAN